MLYFLFFLNDDIENINGDGNTNMSVNNVW